MIGLLCDFGHIFLYRTSPFISGYLRKDNTRTIPKVQLAERLDRHTLNIGSANHGSKYCNETTGCTFVLVNDTLTPKPEDAIMCGLVALCSHFGGQRAQHLDV